MTPPPARSTLFPYTTLFRSRAVLATVGAVPAEPTARVPQPARRPPRHGLARDPVEDRHRVRWVSRARVHAWAPETRSEEHTSELQSRRDLVCRLLLEKKNK